MEARDLRRAGGDAGVSDRGRAAAQGTPGAAPPAPAAPAGARPQAGSPLAPPRAPAAAGEAPVPLLGRIARADVERARRDVNPDACHTAAVLAGRAIRLAEADPSLARLAVPRVCERCLLDALPRLVERGCGRAVDIVWQDAWPPALGAASAERPAASADRPRIGIVGNALLCFDAYLNDGLRRVPGASGLRGVVLPDPANRCSSTTCATCASSTRSRRPASTTWCTCRASAA